MVRGGFGLFTWGEGLRFVCVCAAAVAAAVLLTVALTATPVAGQTGEGRSVAESPSAQVAGMYRLNVTNASNISFSVSWVTDAAVTGTVRYGRTTPPAEKVADDYRGAVITGTTHYVVLDHLLPGTAYYFQVESGSMVDDNGGNYYTLTTGPTLPLGPTDVGYGQAYRSGGSTIAPGTIVYATLVDGDRQGTGGRSSPMSALVDVAGWWSLNVANARVPNLTAYFDYTPNGSDKLRIFADGGIGGIALTETTTARVRPADPIILSGKNMVARGTLSPIIRVAP